MPDGPLRQVLAAITAAGDGAALRAAAEDGHRGVTGEIARRTSSAELAASWSELCATAVAAAVRCVGDDGQWYLSGSVARGEALPGADLETLVVRGPQRPAADALAGASAVHELLSRCGFPEDTHGAFAARARFNRTGAQWAAGITGWAGAPAADRGVVMTGLLSDAVPVAGGPDLRGQTGIAARAHPAALAAMLQDATHARAQVPSRLRVLGGDAPVDVKRAVIDPVVRIARWAALSCGSDAVRTTDRLAAAAGTRYLDAADAQTLDRCYRIGTAIRWRIAAAAFAPARPGSAAPVTMSDLPPRDRAALRGIGAELTGITRKLRYLASTSAFSPW